MVGVCVCVCLGVCVCVWVGPFVCLAVCLGAWVRRVGCRVFVGAWLCALQWRCFFSPEWLLMSSRFQVLLGLERSRIAL